MEPAHERENKQSKHWVERRETRRNSEGRHYSYQKSLKLLQHLVRQEIMMSKTRA